VHDEFLTANQLWEAHIANVATKKFLIDNPNYSGILELVEPYNDRYSSEMLQRFNKINGQPFPDTILHLKNKLTKEKIYIAFDVKIIKEPEINLEPLRGHISISGGFDKKIFMDRLKGALSVNGEHTKFTAPQKKIFNEWLDAHRLNVNNDYSRFQQINHAFTLKAYTFAIPSTILELAPMPLHPLLEQNLTETFFQNSIKDIVSLITEENIFPALEDIHAEYFDDFTKEVVARLPKPLSTDLLYNYKFNKKLIKDNTSDDA